MLSFTWFWHRRGPGGHPTPAAPTSSDLADLAGHAVAASLAAGLFSCPALSLVHRRIDCDHFCPLPRLHSPASRVGAALSIHSDLLVFTNPRRPPALTQKYMLRAHRSPPLARHCAHSLSRPELVGVGDGPARFPNPSRLGRYVPNLRPAPGQLSARISPPPSMRYTIRGPCSPTPCCGIGTTLVESIHLAATPRRRVRAPLPPRRSEHLPHSRRAGCHRHVQGSRRRPPPPHPDGRSSPPCGRRWW